MWPDRAGVAAASGRGGGREQRQRASPKAGAVALFGGVPRRGRGGAGPGAVGASAGHARAGIFAGDCRTGGPEKPVMVAAIAGEDKIVRMVATYDPASRHLVVADAAPVPTPSGRSHELWMIPAGGKPVSMGVMPSGKPMVATIEPAKATAFVDGLTLAVSDEPAGGSPTGQPTGDMLASGALTNS
nr:anti-sigma factor [Sphingomonas rhizophila]